MSQANKDIAKKFITALGAGDAETVKSLITRDIQAILPGSALIAGTRGYEEIVGVCDLFKNLTKSGVRFNIVSTTAEEDRVSMEAEGHSELVNGKAYNNYYHFLFYIREGKVCKIKEYLDTKLADEVMVPLFAGT